MLISAAYLTPILDCGGADHAAALANLAVEKDTPAVQDSLRVEAVEMLGDWAQPSSHDRVLNLWRPLKPRNPAPARKAIQSHFSELMEQSRNQSESAAVHAANEA